MSRKSLAMILLLACMLAMTAMSKAELVDLDPDNFETVVNDPKKDVFVMFHASWCGHCKRMMPTWEDLGTQYPSSGDTVIARIDASIYNEIGAEYGLAGYPTLLLFSKNDKRGIKYQGERKVELFKDFIKKNVV